MHAASVVVNKGARPTIPNDCLPVLSDIMTCCLDSNPNKKPIFSQVLKMLEVAETDIMTNVRRSCFRCCPRPTATEKEENWRQKMLNWQNLFLHRRLVIIHTKNM